MKTARTLLAAAIAAAPALVAAPAGAAEFELIPMLGIADLHSDYDDFDYDAGLAVGVSFGVRLAEIFSLHAQFHFHGLDLDDGDNDNDGLLTIYQVAGLFHVVDDRKLDFVLGPVLGGFTAESEVELPGDDLHYELSGGVFGITAGIFFKLNRSVSLGPTFQYARMISSEACVRRGRTTVCDDVDDDDELSLLLVNAGLKITF